MEPISIQYRMTEPEFMTACNAHWSAQRQSTASNLITSAVAIVIGVALLFLMFWLGLVLAVVGSILLLITGLRSFFWRRAFRDAKKYNDDISVVIGDDSVHVESAEGKSDLKWDFFTWYLDTPEHVLLYMTKRSFSVIPKSAFQDKQRVQDFVDLVKSKIEKVR
jgi:hypothetical protein